MANEMPKRIDYDHITDAVSEQNIAFVLEVNRRWNAHEALVEALKPLAACAEMAEGMPEGTFLCLLTGNGKMPVISREHTIKARAALEAAEEI